MNTRDRGFTLIELMIALAVVALLTAIALPAYQEQLRKTRRAEAKSALLKTIQMQERFYTQSFDSQYTVEVGQLFGRPGQTIYSGQDPIVVSWYQITSEICPGETLQTCIRAVATPRAGYTDDNCGILTLNSRGVRTEAGNKDLAYCWGN